MIDLIQLCEISHGGIRGEARIAPASVHASLLRVEPCLDVYPPGLDEESCILSQLFPLLKSLKQFVSLALGRGEVGLTLHSVNELRDYDHTPEACNDYHKAAEMSDGVEIPITH